MRGKARTGSARQILTARAWRLRSSSAQLRRRWRKTS